MLEFPHDFLDDNVYQLVADFRKKHPEQYKLVFLIAELISEIMNDEECKKFNNDREKYIICTLYECYTTFSSEILLLERGLVSDFHVLLRTFYEKKFKLLAVIKSKRNYKKIVEEQEYYSTSLVKQILDNKNNMFADLVGKIKEEEYDFDTYEKKKMSVESWANNSSLSSEYAKQYALLSPKTHYGLSSLVEKLKTGDDGSLIYLAFSYENFDENLIIACYEMMVCIEKFLEFISCEKYNYKIKKIEKKIKKFLNQLKRTKSKN